MRRHILVAMADSHGGMNQGLLSPETVLERDDESGQIHSYSPQLTPFQELLYRLYINHVEQVKQLAGKDQIIFLHVGDLTQGNRFEENWVTSRLSDQIIIAYYNLRPWMKLKNVRTVRISKGTGVHVFKEGSSEILVSKLLVAENPAKSILCIYHGLMKIDDFVVDYAHHGPPAGSREWLKGNVARLYLSDVMKRSLKRGRQPPDLVIRAHYHEYSRAIHIEQWGNNDEYISNIVTLPSYCGGGDNGIKASRSRDALHIGLLAFEIVNGKLLDIHRFYETIDLRTEETVDGVTG